MMKITPSGESLGARIEGIDLSQPLSDEDQEAIKQALGRYGVVSFPNQNLEAEDLKTFSSRFGTLEINVANAYQEPGHPEVMILSNIVVDGKPLGLADAGQDWHTDMSYSKEMAFANVLYGIEIPRRNGEPLGCTEFCNMRQAYLDLPEELKTKLEGRTATHDFNKFWEAMRRERGSKRPPLTPEQRAKKPPVSHPIFMNHPITGEKVLYCNPGYAEQIDGMDKAESDEILAFLFKHQLQDKYRYRHRWTEHDVLMWDNFGTIHNAVADYTPEEHRLIKRCQVMADQVMAEAAAAA
ncbi:TauD/TfdA dioxygenase family protein [Acuticoccus mangrovi]|uniref:TauD/TfdA family dioxygenase n=1 Tax=Acuticoccus mangrovi TaxID=2796142 RepID=A0A934II57_9HYPH|nr:TauD/TfdA family dioxygenase [Acuticoccus mangrovi]MBJ3776913.1 TauD/TfdA family dioxygenase [Acuticoccus mangrovi]